MLLGERYQLVGRLELFSVGAERVAGVAFEYWTALDVTSGVEVWVQFAAHDGVYADGAALAGAVAALRRINHPAVPAVAAFGEYEFEREGAAAAVGYCAFPAGAGETLAAALLRETLDQAEILAALGQVAEVLELLAEFELVHGRLSAHSVLLGAAEGGGYEVVLVDLPASLALETALESELTVAADVYALAWLTVLALVGPELLEAEFGSGFAVTAEFELLAAGEVVERRLAWAAQNLLVLGLSAELAEVLLLSLGEAGARPRAAALTAALRAEWMLYAESAAVAESAVQDVAVVEDVAALAAAAEAAQLAAVAGVAGAAELVAEEVVEEQVVEEQVVEEQAVERQAGGQQSSKKSKKAKAAEAGEVALLAGAVGVMGAASAQAATGAGAAAAVTEVIPKIRQGSGAARTTGAGSGAAGGAGRVRTASPSGPVGGGSGSSGAGGSGGSGGQHGRKRRAHPGVLVGGGLALVIIIVLIIVFSTGPSKSTATASTSNVSSASASASGAASASATSTSAAGTGSSPSASASASGSAAASPSAAATSSGSSATATSPAGQFPTTLETVPATASEAVQEIQSAVSQAQGQLSGAQRAQLSQIIGTLNQEINSQESISTGIAQLWALLHSGELPSSLNTYLIQLATYLSASQGS